jgi:hypothetical protein
VRPTTVSHTDKHSEQVLKLNDATDSLGKMREVVAANTKTVSFFGARAMVFGKFFDAVLPHLTLLQRVEIIRSFRQGIEDTLSAMDDVALPAEYHSALLGLTNTILAALDQEPDTRE